MIGLSFIFLELNNHFSPVLKVKRTPFHRYRYIIHNDKYYIFLINNRDDNIGLR